MSDMYTPDAASVCSLVTGGYPSLIASKALDYVSRTMRWRCGPQQVALIDLLPSVEKTPLFSLRENAIAKEPGLRYPERWPCVSRLGCSNGGSASFEASP